MAADEEQKKGGGKGFAGLSSLVSDVDTTPPPAARNESAGTAGAASSTASPSPQAAQPQPQPQPQPSQRRTYQEPPQPSAGSSGGKWVLGIVAVIGVLWLIGQSNKTATSSAPAYSPPAQSTATSYSPPAQPQAPSRPTESKPPVGQDLVFSSEQIRYCLAEDIRMDGAKPAVNNYSDSDVDRFNTMVADYNSRCGNFRYRRGALEDARRDVEPYRTELAKEGQERFAASATGSNIAARGGLHAGGLPQSTNSRVDSPAQQTNSDTYAFAPSRREHPAQDSQDQSDDARPREPNMSELSSDEKFSVSMACSPVRSQGAAAYNRCLASQVQALQSGPREPNMSELSSDEKFSVSMACSPVRSQGAAAYNRCLASQVQALQSGTREPNMSELSSDEKFSVSMACSPVRSQGAAAYNRCLASQVQALQSGPREPNMSALSSDEKFSVSMACSPVRSQGAAAYNRCLVAQLRSIGR